MKGLLGRIVKRLFAVAGALVIVLALLVGALRLLIAQIPGYQQELRAWVNETLGVDATFAAIDARFGIRGPEIDLRSVSLRAAGAGQQFLDAERATLTLDPWQLLQRRISISRLTVDNGSLSIERTDDGALQVRGLRLPAGSRDDPLVLLPASVEFAIRRSEVTYFDHVADRLWEFTDLDVEFLREPQYLDAELSVQPPAELAGEIRATAAQSGAALQVDASIDGLALEAAAAMLPFVLPDGLAGSGDLELSGTWQSARLTAGTLQADLADVAVDGQVPADYERVAFDGRLAALDGAGYEVTLTDIDVSRDDRGWPASSAAFRLDGDGRFTEVSADFLRLEDLSPFVARFATDDLIRRWRRFAPRGDLEGVQLRIAGGNDFTFESRFRGVGIDPSDDLPGFDGLDGEIRAGRGAGTISLAGSAVTVEWPSLIDGALGGGTLGGTVVWRRGQDGLRVLSDALRFDLFGEPFVTNFEFAAPTADRGPYLDLHGAITQLAITDAKTLLPKEGLPPSVSNWLQSALLGGTGRDVVVEFTGELANFPFDDGEGRFSVVAEVYDASMEFIADWPVADELNGRVEFVNAGFAAGGSGRILESRTESLDVAIRDMREPVLEIDAVLNGQLGDVLEFVQTAPLIARHLGPGFERLHAPDGTAATALDLDLPLLSFADYTLAGAVEVGGGTLELDGFRADATDVAGVLELRNAAVSGDSLRAVLFGGPVDVSVRPAELAGYRYVLDFLGETTSDAVFDTFALPLRDLIDGQTLWSGQLLLPQADPAEAGPLTIEISSNLSGVALDLPEPMAKPPGEPVNLRALFSFDGEDSLAVTGNVGATRRFEMLFGRRDGAYALSRGSVAFGGDDPLLPLRGGLVVQGRIPRLRLDDWLEVSSHASIGRARPLFNSAELDINDFEAFGQRLGATRLEVGRGDRVWNIDIESTAIAGTVEVPLDLQSRAQVIADMDRVYLALGDGERPDVGDADPQRFPGLRLRAAEFGFGTRELGRVEAEVISTPRGLRLESFTSATSNYSLDATGSWLAGPGGSTSRVTAEISSQDVAATLAQLGIDPVVEAEAGSLSAEIYWDGAPSSGWLDHLNGEVALNVSTGSLIEIDPGAGRVVGLMSIAALPRRLLLDFRDVFNKGFSFDEITGSFLISDGNAYTDNLKLSGPAAEIGIIGRTGLRDRDYQQQAVVTTEPGNVLPTVGGLLAGAGVGAALLIFTRIFKEPLKGIGRASYCVTGSWDAPSVERITSQDADEAAQCVSLPALMAGAGDG